MSRGRASGSYTGLQCPTCHKSGATDVLDSRDAPNKQSRRRRHLCKNCKGRFTTYEVTASEYKKLQTVNIMKKQIRSVNKLLQLLENANGTT